MGQIDLDPLTQAVQRNCDIADARFAGDFTMCVYLLKMREYFRWDIGAEFDVCLPPSDTGNWVSQREQLWEQLEDIEYQPVSVGECQFDPFDVVGIGGQLSGLGLAYGSGLGVGDRAHFFLGELERSEPCEGYQLTVVGKEYARDLPSPPAMMQGRTIIVRRESLRRMLWERYDQWAWNQPDNAMARALQLYGFESDPIAAVTAMTESELEAVLLHEIGEIKAGELLGSEQWRSMMTDIPRSKAELMLRAVKDHLADCISTLPGLIKINRPELIHFYIGNLAGMRQYLFPKLRVAYDRYLQSGTLSQFADLAEEGAVHWQTLGLDILNLYRDVKDVPVKEIERRCERAIL